MEGLRGTTPLRFTCRDQELKFEHQVQHDELLMIKERHFEKAEDFIKEASRIITLIKNQARPWSNQNYYPMMSLASYSFLFEKMDHLYHQKSIELESLFKKPTWDKADYEKEKEIKFILKELVKCDLTVQDFVDRKDGYAADLHAQVETVFDDYEILNVLLLVIYEKMNEEKEDMMKLTVGTLHFVFPFLKVFYNGKGNVLDFWKDHQNFLKNMCSIEDLIKEVERLMKRYTDFGDIEISRLCQEIESASRCGEMHTKRRALRGVTQEKKRFKEENGYYEVLGNLSLIFYLWNQEANGSEISLPLLKIGMVSYLYALTGWKCKKTSFTKNTCEFYSKFCSLNCEFELDLPIKMLQCIFDELNKKGLNEGSLQVLETTASVVKCLLKCLLELSFKKNQYGEVADQEIVKELEKWCDQILKNQSDGEDEKSFTWHVLFEFLSKNVRILNEVQSDYLIEHSLSQNLFAGWLEFFEKINAWGFNEILKENDSRVKEKYFLSLQISLRGIVSFAVSKEANILILPEYLQDQLVWSGMNMYRDGIFLTSFQFEEIFLCVEEIGIEFLKNVKSADKKTVSRLRVMLNLLYDLITTRVDVDTESGSESSEFIDRIYESKLIEEFMRSYEDNKFVLRESKDLYVIEGVWKLFSFIAELLPYNSSFLVKERNMELLKSVILDSVQVDLRLVSRQCAFSFCEAIKQRLFNNEEFKKNLKDMKLLFGAIRIYLFGPYVYGWENFSFIGYICESYSQTFEEQKTVLNLFEKLLAIFEEKMKNPSWNLEESFNEFFNSIESWEVKQVEPCFGKMESVILSEETSFESLRMVCTAFASRLLPFLVELPRAFKPKFEDLKEQFSSLIKRYMRICFSPVFALFANPSTLRNIVLNITESLKINNEKYLWLIVESYFTSFIDVCKEFKFTEYSVISKFDRKRLYRVIRDISSFGFLSRENVFEDLTTQEATLASTMISLRSFNASFRDQRGQILKVFKSLEAKEFNRFESLLKEMTLTVAQTQNNILKCIVPYIVQENFEKMNTNLKVFAKSCEIFFKEKKLDLGLLEGLYEAISQNPKLHLMVEDNVKLLFENLDLYKLNLSDDQTTILSGILYNGLRLKEFDSGMIGNRLFGSPNTLKVLLAAELDFLNFWKIHADAGMRDLIVPMIKILERLFAAREVSIREDCSFNELSEVIMGFITSLGALSLPREIKKLTENNTGVIFSLFEKLYQHYSKEIQEKVAHLPEKRKTVFYNKFKAEVKNYTDAVIKYRGYLKETFALGEILNAIPREYWTQLFENRSKALECFLNEKKFEKGDLVDQVYQFDSMYQDLKYLFIEDIISEVNISKDFVERLVLVLKHLLHNLVSEDLTLFRIDEKYFDLPEIMNSLISNISKLVINYIISHVVNENCHFDDIKEEGDFQNLLQSGIDMCESIFDLQQHVLNDLRRDMFDGTESCFGATVCLIDSILRANQGLQVEFMNRDLLRKLLCVQKLSLHGGEQTKAILFLMITLLEDSKSKDNDEKKISPFAEQCLQVLLTSLIENYSFEKTSIASYKRLQEKEESKRIKEFLTQRIMRGDGFLPIVDQGEEEDYESNVYLNNLLERKVIQKDTSALIVILSGILSHMPQLVPLIAFKEISAGDDFVNKLGRDDETLLMFFQSEFKKRWSLLDVILRVVLWKDGSSGIFLIASLIENNMLLFKILEVMEDMLKCEENQSEALESVGSQLFRRNIAMIILFISNEMNKKEMEKEDFIQLIISISQRLLANSKTIVSFVQEQQMKNHLIKILSEIVMQNISQSMPIKNNYSKILKFLETRPSSEVKTSSVDWRESFEKRLFEKKAEQKISKKDQKRFERWNMKGISLAVDKDVLLAADFCLGSILDENLSISSLRKAKCVDLDESVRLGFLIKNLHAKSVRLNEYTKENVQDFANNIESEILLSLFKVDLTKIEQLKDQEVIENIFENIKEEEEEKVGEIEQNQAQQNLIQPDVKTEPKEECQEKSAFKHFMDVTVKNEKDFKFKVNKALKQGTRVKEMICAEKVLSGSDKNKEEIIKQFTLNMTEFERNVVYASLGKSFEAGLSEDCLNIVREARAELLSIQKDFSKYEEEKNKIPHFEAGGEEDIETASDYDELDYDISFLADDDEEEEEKKDNNSEANELIYEEAWDSSTNEKISKIISTFEVDDTFIMRACELLFYHWNLGGESLQKVKELLKDSLSLNPANELKILDTVITVLYSPEFFECGQWRNQVKAYDCAVETLLSFLSDYLTDSARSYIFFVPRIYLERFGNKILKDLKERTNFAEKTSDCYSFLDMIIGLTETRSFLKNQRWIVQILERVESFLLKEKNIKAIKDLSQTSLEKYQKAVSSKKTLKLLNLLENPITRDNKNIKSKVQEIFMGFKYHPELFLIFKDDLSKIFCQLVLTHNPMLESFVKILKEGLDKEISAREVLMNLSKIQMQNILMILFSFANVFQYHLFGSKDKKGSSTKTFHTLLQIVKGSLFAQEDIQLFFVNCHELLELIHKAKSHLKHQEEKLEILIAPLILTCVGHYAIVKMESPYKEEEGSKTDLSESSLSDIGNVSSIVSFEETEDVHEIVPRQKSYSHYRRETNVDFGVIFANFALKYSQQISKIFVSQSVGLESALNGIISNLILSLPWILDFKTKLSIFHDQIKHLLTKNDIDNDDRATLEIDRIKIVYSAINCFKNSQKRDLLQLVYIRYKNEEGADGGGLRRDFFENTSKQLFDPATGLFKLAENLRSIQPNPSSSIVPYDLTLIEFAGIILAKAISDKMVLDVTFTKPFLKHLLGKKITIADMEEVDADLGKNLRWMLQNNVEDLYLTFTHETEVLNERTVVELKEGGSDLFVDEENKKEYVKQICEYRLTKQIKKQLKAFLKGFRTIIPQDFISHFSPSELETLISGESQINLEEMKKYATYRNYSLNDQIVIWLWEVLEEFSQEQLISFYYYLSGSTRVPFGGFRENPVEIQHHFNKEALPISHTCTLTLELPQYATKDKLREKLLLAIFDGAGEFQIG